MGTNILGISAGYPSSCKHVGDLNQLALDEDDDKRAWLAADDEIRGEEPETTPEIFHSIFPQH